MSFKPISKKAVCLSLLLCGYQAGAVCKSSMEYLLGAAVAASTVSALGWAYTYYKLKGERQKLVDHEAESAAYRKRFSEHELIDDINAYVNQARLACSTCLSIYAGSDSLDKKREKIGAHVMTIFTVKTYEEYAEDLKKLLTTLKNHKKELETAKIQFQGNKSKELLIPQIDPVLKKFDDLIPMLELACQELPYALCLKFLETHGLYEAEHEVATALGDAREIKFRLEQAVDPFVVKGARYPYSAYYAQLGTSFKNLQWLTDQLKGWNPQPWQIALVTKIQDRYKEIAALRSYVKNSQEMIVEERHQENERRLQEEARIAEQKRKEAERRLREERWRADQKRLELEREVAQSRKKAKKNNAHPKPSAPPLTDSSAYTTPPAPGSHASNASAPSWSDIFQDPTPPLPSAPPLD